MALELYIVPHPSDDDANYPSLFLSCFRGANRAAPGFKVPRGTSCPFAAKTTCLNGAFFGLVPSTHPGRHWWRGGSSCRPCIMSHRFTEDAIKSK